MIKIVSRGYPFTCEVGRILENIVYCCHVFVVETESRQCNLLLEVLFIGTRRFIGNQLNYVKHSTKDLRISSHNICL